ncbi:glycosyltransferase [Psychroflexus sp. YR1-1]|uniref:Glycosyltransferase n=1 Tax=Psychroflexus aurantiacus TaxID=2709310 RepID=A0A6B3R352_9FLAO|nr:glycosyltransferase [Psychroflexus aurantiacus]NEV93940.1 glycosyltransferase [Psychroflexus aurantiacus]
MSIISIIYAYHNRDTARIQASLESLSGQTQQNFEVVFVDYGSREYYSNEVKAVVEDYQFVNYHYIGHPGLLWCKARALNYGIQQAVQTNIFIADADVVFHSDFVKELGKLDTEKAFYLFDIAYLKASVNAEEVLQIDFQKRDYSHVHETFGVALFSKQALLKVNGLDNFFHFYGSEDEDLNRRLQHAGYRKQKHKDLLLQHIWHERYPKSKDKNFTIQPRLTDVMRLNQKHMLFNDENQVSYTNRGIGLIRYYTPEDLERLKHPEVIFRLTNICDKVDYYLYFAIEELLNQHKVVKFEFNESNLPKSTKYKIKKLLGKTVQAYYPFKTVNDLLLKQILFRFRDYNYSLEIQKQPNTIHFTIENFNNA